MPTRLRLARLSPFAMAAMVFGVGLTSSAADLPGGPAPEPALIAADVMYAHFIDVGQADATLLEFSCGAVLVDAGGQNAVAVANDLVAYLEDFFARRTDLDRTLNAVFVTHNHVDHTRGLREVVDAFTVERVLENGQRGGLFEAIRDLRWLEFPDSSGVPLRDLDQSEIDDRHGLTDDEIDAVPCPGVDPVLRILSADQPERPDGWSRSHFDNKNNHSLVLRVDFGEASFLFTGDLEEDGIELLIEHYEGTDVLDVDVYQIGHHGSRNATNQDLLEAMSPAIAVGSMSACDQRQGLFNGYQFGHPRSAIVSLLQQEIVRRRSTKRVFVADGQRRFRAITMRDAVFTTAWDGTVRIRATAEGRYRVTNERPPVPDC